METWKDVPGFEGLYQVSDLGRIKSFKKSKKFKSPMEYILTPSLTNSGYCIVTLYGENTRRKFLVHRLVATVFLPNPHNLPQINHKDENKTNNSVKNLEWCTAEYNNAYGTARIRSIDTKSTPIAQKTYDGKTIAVYRSTRIASEILGINIGTLRSAIQSHSQCRGHYYEYCDTLHPSHVCI